MTTLDNYEPTNQGASSKSFPDCYELALLRWRAIMEPHPRNDKPKFFSFLFFMSAPMVKYGKMTRTMSVICLFSCIFEL